ncbi:MAG: hypothetical protein CFE23_11615 [Flavobacterium sp. BFFFF1]|uniref:restriction endonuclease subunit S n=1 Tax=Flavobacterium sp. BFFFF1 TaxID=2015557 RepID=UPI000BC8D245|nr:restriction endonuclease subunit S [Flavobacterium sp. BFFFF1]OYU79896.1 MAG: hypothetical protein CFE23_11615 [Flavobacterium sp. BFFFF1]
MEKLVPRLRFPGFEGEWDLKKLGDITTWASGGTPPKDESQYWNGNIPWISASTMRGLEYSNSHLKLSEAGVKKGSKIAKVDSLLLLVRGSMLFNKIPIGIVTKDVAFNQDVKSIVVDIESATSKYILSWFIANEPLLLEMVTGTGIGAGKLDLTELKNLNILLPSIDEQTKISLLITSVENRLESLKQKKTLLEKYKKGMMQQIFSQEVRFKDDDGGDFGEWENLALSEIGFTYGGLSGKSGEDFGEGKPYIQYKQIFDDSKIDSRRFGYVAIKENENQNSVRYGDTFFTTSSETANEVAYSSVLLENVDELYLNSFCFGFRPNSLEQLRPEFAQFLFRSKSFRDEVIKLAQGSTRYNISKVQLLKTIVALPTAKEQTKIANFLSAIDDKIALVGKEIAGVEMWKKGLLGEMFV